MNRRRRAHLELMSKPRLIGLIEDSEERADTHLRTATYWRGIAARLLHAPTQPRPVTPETTREDAEAILARLPVDPDADQHRTDLWHAIQPEPRPLKPIDHGTVRGYWQHKRRPDTPCRECKAAVAADQRTRDAAKRGAA